MELPPLHNSRAPQQWEIISKYVDIAGKTVLDLGCGYGDILFRCKEAGARECIGIDKGTSEKALNIAQNWMFEAIGFADFDLNNELDQIPQAPVKQKPVKPWDVIICFSVLPYLDNPPEVLGWIREHSEIALIECQYANDGPGFLTIKDDRDFEAFLIGCGFRSAKSIGRTLVEGRNKYRTIWLCQ